MVDVPTSIEMERLLQRYKFANVTSGKGLSLLLEQIVEIIDIATMMSTVV